MLTLISLILLNHLEWMWLSCVLKTKNSFLFSSVMSQNLKWREMWGLPSWEAYATSLILTESPCNYNMEGGEEMNLSCLSSTLPQPSSLTGTDRLLQNVNYNHFLRLTLRLCFKTKQMQEIFRIKHCMKTCFLLLWRFEVLCFVLFSLTLTVL